MRGGDGVADNKEMCFVIMPISDPDGYDKGHFESVYKDIFVPAIEKAGYSPHRVDEDASSGLIQAKIFENLINAPMAICDLSTRNPNVLFELGIRQAYDKPVILVQETGTERIFDISGISCIDYDPSLIYRSVLDSQEKIAKSIQETEKNPQYNSLATALSISAAKYEQKNFETGDLNTILLRDIVDKLDSVESRIGRISCSTDPNYDGQLSWGNVKKTEPMVEKRVIIRKRKKGQPLSDYVDYIMNLEPDNYGLTQFKAKILQRELEDESLTWAENKLLNEAIEELKRRG